ncbi:hypothetical protein DL98DRAFT_309323 [Cadophora sp. DSE1049]|nr:hypothetical protein DL98DRAFT_309323 [Cadophora sp. DSE1049]
MHLVVLQNCKRSLNSLTSLEKANASATSCHIRHYHVSQQTDKILGRTRRPKRNGKKDSTSKRVQQSNLDRLLPRAVVHEASPHNKGHYVRHQHDRLYLCELASSTSYASVSLSERRMCLAPQNSLRRSGHLRMLRGERLFDVLQARSLRNPSEWLAMRFA